jgi:SAM-dependent methyltransferase
MFDYKKLIYNFIKKTSSSGIEKIVNDDEELRELWNKSLKCFPDFTNHFSIAARDDEVEKRIRVLIVHEVLFIKSIIEDLLEAEDNKVSYADIGDSDGSVRYILRSFFSENKCDSIGINLQQKAVDKMKQIGLEAICADAMDLAKRNISYDVISLFETLEHLPNPIGFLNDIHRIVKKKLVISVPYIRSSRIALKYLSDNWSKTKSPTIENQHIFELSPVDWKKLFSHTGWRIDREMKLMMYPKKSIHRLILEPYWRYTSFDGFWFVSLIKDESYSSRYRIE